ncbi:MAG: hypothetical protein AB1758_05005 [Candidatus Eremiobacterota bacterium]
MTPTEFRLRPGNMSSLTIDLKDRLSGARSVERLRADVVRAAVQDRCREAEVDAYNHETLNLDLESPSLGVHLERDENGVTLEFAREERVDGKVTRQIRFEHEGDRAVYSMVLPGHNRMSQVVEDRGRGTLTILEGEPEAHKPSGSWYTDGKPPEEENLPEYVYAQRSSSGYSSGGYHHPGEEPARSGNGSPWD